MKGSEKKAAEKAAKAEATANETKAAEKAAFTQEISEAPAPVETPPAPVETPPAPPAKPNTVKKPLAFNNVDTGDFEVHDFRENPVFVGRYVGTEQIEGFEDKNTKLPKDMLVFRDYETGGKVIMNPSYALEKMFVHKVSETPIDWENKPIFQVKFTGQTETASGNKVSNFLFSVAYEESEENGN